MAGKFLKFFAGIASLWLVFHLIYEQFPYARAGAELVGERKEAWLRAAPIFAASSTQAVRLAVFGNSKALSGFVPELFDQLSGRQIYSVNCGFPGRCPLLPVLRDMVRQGQIPTHVLTLQPWSSESPRAPWRTVQDENALRKQIFPFKDLPRDTFLFALRSTTRGGLPAYYSRNRIAIEEMLNQRGYYFIEGQSHSATHRLPEGFHLESDRPEVLYTRNVSADAAEFQELVTLLRTHRIRLYLVPTYFRRGEYAVPSDPVDGVARRLGDGAEVGFLGPEYLVYGNDLFSDAVHLNPEGARHYTSDLWRIAGRVVLPEATPAGQESGLQHPAGELSSLR